MNYAGFIAGVTIAALAVTAGASMADTPKKDGKGQRPSFEQLDTNGDGQLTQAEMENARAARFAKADTNGDGALSADELSAAGHEKAKERSAKMMEKFDANGDGVLSPDEMPKPRNAGKMFDRMDADGSGGVSKEEFDAASAKMKEQGHKGHKKHKKDDSEQN